MDVFEFQFGKLKIEKIILVICLMFKVSLAAAAATDEFIWTGGTCCGQNQPQYIHNPAALVSYFLSPGPNNSPSAYTTCTAPPTALGQSCYVYAWSTHLPYTSEANCPVPELREVKDIPPNGPDVLPLTLRLENTKGSDLALLPAAEEGVACLKRKATGVFVSSGTRTVAYQAHLKEIWDKLIELDDLEDAAEIKACKSLRDKVIAEKGCNGGHCIKYPPATTSKHTIGKAFDVSMATIDMLRLKLRPNLPPPKLPLLPPPPLTPVQQHQADIQLIADWLASPAACNLNWGGSFQDPDFVHFAVP